MVTSRTSPQAAVATWDRGCGALRSAALSYVHKGWPVAPGPVCDGMRYTHPVLQRNVGGTVPMAQVTLDERVVARWWVDDPHTVLTPAGAVFDVLCAPTLLATVATGMPLFQDDPCPVAMSPQGARFLVRPGAVLQPDMLRIRGMEILPAGTLLALPPSRVLAGVISWRITPAAAQFRLADADRIQSALRAALLPAGL